MLVYELYTEIDKISIGLVAVLESIVGRQHSVQHSDRGRQRWQKPVGEADECR